MTNEAEISPAARAARLLQRGTGTIPARRQPLRRLLRRLVLRVMQPVTYHQRALDAEIVAALGKLEAELERVAERDGERIARVEQLARELIMAAEALRAELAGIEHESHAALVAAGDATGAVRSTLAELNALPHVEGELFETLQSPVGKVQGFRAPSDSRRRQEHYAAFQDLFRGSRERVVESQRPYLALMSDHQPVLDVGCGRGELLSLLAERGIEASGVDSDEAMVKRCKELGLRVTHATANEHLRTLPDGSLGAIFSAQVIEHLAYGELRAMIEIAAAKLRPGGLLIAETVNPHRIASLKTFWVDLTHHHPIFPEVALALCWIAGYASAYVFAPGYDSFEHARFDSPAYALVAETADPASDGQSGEAR